MFDKLKKKVFGAGESTFKLIATKGDDKLLSLKFTRAQFPEAIDKVLETDPQTVLIVKSK